jgi:chemotaxis protein methyltransferase CheR
MDDSSCVRFLQWLLPQQRMRWAGFRKVRKQVCKRIQRRIRQLELADIDAYGEYLQQHRQEWSVLDHLCRVTVSRFYRDRIVLEHVYTEVLPELAQTATQAGDSTIQGWSAGCAMGEEAYSLILIWDKTTGNDFPQLDIHVIGSDIDELLLQRASNACYAYGSVKALPHDWLQAEFSLKDNLYCLKPRLRRKASFIQQDIRERQITGPFHIIFCRNMVFTYYEQALQQELLAYIHNNLVDGGALIIGGHESLPGAYSGFEPWPGQRAIFRKISKQ